MRKALARIVMCIGVISLVIAFPAVLLSLPFIWANNALEG